MFLDNLYFEFVHFLSLLAGDFFTPFFKFISMLGEKGWFFLFIAFLLLLRKRTRWIGTTIIISVAIGWVTADLIIKPWIQRLRPYLSSSAVYYQYWLQAGSIEEKGFSMPSGHTIAVTSFFTSLFITCKKNIRKGILIAGITFTLLMITSRCYFMHHYFTDCLVGIIFGIVSSLTAKVISKIIRNTCLFFSNIPLFSFIINFDIFSRFEK